MTRFALLTLPACALAGTLAAAQVDPNGVMLRQPDVSRDEIVFLYDGDLWVVPKVGGTARRVTSDDGPESYPKFSPDGRTIAFMASYDGGSDLYRLDLTAGLPERITYHPGREMLSEWTPEGDGLLFYSGEVAGNRRAPKVMQVSAEGGQPDALPVPWGTYAAIDPTGTWLAYTPFSREFRTWKRYRGGHARADVWVYDLEDGSSVARDRLEHPGTDSLPDVARTTTLVLPLGRGPRATAS